MPSPLRLRQLCKMLIPDPTDLLRCIILIPCQPQLALYGDHVEDLAADIGEVGIVGFAAGAVDIEFVDRGGKKENRVFAVIGTVGGRGRRGSGDG